MAKRDEHRRVSSGRASEAAAERLRGSLRREVGDLEVRLEEAQLRSGALLDAGFDAEAAKVLDESRQLVDAFHRRLEAALADAAVEREAERVLASADDVVDVLGEGTESTGVLARIPAGMGAAVASLAVFAMAVLTLRAPTERGLEVAGDVTALPAPSASDEEPEGTERRLSPDLLRRASSLSAADLEVLAAVAEPEAVVDLLERRRRLLDRIGSEPVTATVLAELDQLVAALRIEGVDVDRLILLEQRRKAAATQEQRVEEPTTEQQPQPAPSEEPQEADAPQEGEDGSDEEGVFPLGDDEEPEEEGDGEGAGASGSDSGSKDEDEGLLGQ